MDRSLGENLIFIISQPRAGSTLLQRILGNHPDLHTVSEPWLMLHPFYCLECQGLRAEYNEVVAQSAVQNFLGTLPNREDEYFEGVRRMYTYLYESSLTTAGKRYFLDKTPRYYFVIPQLYRTFPKAHFLILYRNPLAVLCSIISTWARENWFSLFQFKHDLIRAPGLLNEGIQFLGERAMVVHYEELVGNAERVIQDICKTIGLEFDPQITSYGHQNLPLWLHGDNETIYQEIEPVPETAAKWQEQLYDSQMWRLTKDYLGMMGEKTVTPMGYPYQELVEILESHRPLGVRLTFSLAWLLRKPAEQRKRWEIGALKVAGAL
jgi:hypothetical protein